jgi:hypothetical protein
MVVTQILEIRSCLCPAGLTECILDMMMVFRGLVALSVGDVDNERSL